MFFSYYYIFRQKNSNKTKTILKNKPKQNKRNNICENQYVQGKRNILYFKMPFHECTDHIQILLGCLEEEKHSLKSSYNKCSIIKISSELNNSLIKLELILSTFLNTYITFIVEGKITDSRSFRGRSISFFYIIYLYRLYFYNIYLYRLYC